MATISYLFEEPEVSLNAPRRDTKSVGDRSEATVLAALVRHGFLCSIPFGENHRYDLIADDGQNVYRAQVKTGRLKNGAISYANSSSHQHRRSGPTSTRSYFGQIDFLAVYCPQNGKVYLVPESELVATRAHLRVEPAVNRQEKGIRWAARFELT